MGGPLATLEPERCAPHVDVVFEGECENIWPEFCRDWERGEPRRHYLERGSIDLRHSPVPRYDLLRRGAYASLPIQASRGCPYDCEFCDIIVMQGRKVRAKPPDQVIAELEAIRSVGGDAVFFTDDNFVGNPKQLSDLLDRILAHRRESGFTPHLFTQATVTLADRPRLLAKMVEAGFTRVFLGIETPRRESLAEAGKHQNLRGNLLDRIHTLQRAGLMTWAGMIVGFDHDDEAVFREQAEFLDEAGIAVAMIGMLNAPPRTPLHARLKRDGRIDPQVDWTDMCAWTNIVPRQMTRARLFRGFAELIEEVYAQEAFARRVLSNVQRMQAGSAAAGSTRLPTLQDWGDLGRALQLYSLNGDAVWRRHFLPNFLRILVRQPSRLVEGAVHLGMWSHFARYVPEVAARLRDSAVVEERRAAHGPVAQAPGRNLPLVASAGG
jgi:radical SAM superfamily enzyme YgiQ (UPF0313 family)